MQGPPITSLRVRNYTNMLQQGNGGMPRGALAKHFQAGVLFVTYSLLVTGAKLGAAFPETTAALHGDEDDQPPPPSSYNMPVAPGSRLAQLITWLQDGKGDPLIIFDEVLPL